MTMDANGGTAPGPNGRLLSPAVRERAAELGIPLAALRDAEGSGPHGRVLVADLERLPRTATAAPSIASAAAGRVTRAAVAGTGHDGASAAPVTVALSDQQLMRARRALADARTAADLTSAVEVDLSDAVTSIQRERSVELGSDEFADALLARFASAVLATLGRHPMLNALIDMETDGGRTILRRDVHLGLVREGTRGESRFTIEHADTLTAEELDARLRSAGLLARAGLLGTSAVALGDTGSDTGAAMTFAIIDRHRTPVLFETPPLPEGCSAAVALGRVEKRPISRSDDPGIRIAWASYLSMTYDHRLVDGADAARFLSDLAARLGPAQGQARSGGR